MDLPKQCFCACGRDIGLTTANMNGVSVAISLMQWLNYLALMREAASQSGGNFDGENLDAFLDDGRECYMSLLAENHEGLRQSRQDRKTTTRWLKFSRKSQKKVARGMPFDPFETLDDSPVGPVEVRKWVFTEALPTARESGSAE